MKKKRIHVELDMDVQYRKFVEIMSFSKKQKQLSTYYLFESPNPSYMLRVNEKKKEKKKDE